jgi:hypothetical protein
VILDGNIPSNLGTGANETRIITARTPDLYLWEGPIQTRVLTEDPPPAKQPNGTYESALHGTKPKNSPSNWLACKARSANLKTARAARPRKQAT